MTRHRTLLRRVLWTAFAALTTWSSPFPWAGAAESAPPAAPAPATNAPAGTPTMDSAAPATTTSEATDRDPRAERSERSDRPDRDPRRSSRRGSDRRRDRGDGASEIATNTPTQGTDLASFKIITDRNIFNPNRGRGSGRSDREAARRPVQVDLITLVGALSYAKGDFAFFDGSSSQYRKTLKCGDSIAGYTVKAIQTHSVQLEAGDKTHDLAIGAQLRREDEGEWQFIARTDATAMPAAGSPGSETGGGSSASGSSASGASGGGAADDILQRLMRKREQEK